MITVFDLQKMEIAWELPYDQGVLPLIIESNPDGSGHRIFAQLNQTNGFSVVDFATHKEVARIKNPDEPKGFTPGCEGISHGIGISPDQKTLWTNSRPANAVFVYSLPDLKLMGHVSLPETPVPGKAPRGGGPAWITFTPDSRTVYVSTCGTKSVTAIDVEAMKANHGASRFERCLTGSARWCCPEVVVRQIAASFRFVILSEAKNPSLIQPQERFLGTRRASE